MALDTATKQAIMAEYATVEGLVAQMGQDVERTREVLARHPDG